MGADVMKIRYKNQDVDLVLWDKVNLGCGEGRQEERMGPHVRASEREGGQSIL